MPKILTYKPNLPFGKSLEEQFKSQIRELLL